MASKVERYRELLRTVPGGEWEELLLRESGLPGPGGNLELLGRPGGSAG